MKFIAGILVGVFVTAMYLDTAATKQKIADMYDWVTVEITSLGS